MSFASRLKNLASETAIYGVSSILGRMINYLLVPFYTWVFEPQRYGVVLAVYAGLVVLNIVYTYGMEAAYLTFASKSDSSRNLVFSTSTWTLLASSVLLSILFVGLNDTVAAALALEERWTYLLNYAAALVFLDTMAVVPFADLRLQNRPWRFAGIRLFGIGVNVGLNIVLIVGFDWGVTAVLLANVIASGAVLLCLIPTFVSNLRWRFAFDLQRKLLRFGLPFLPSGIGFAMTEVINRTYIGRMSAERVMERYDVTLDQVRAVQDSAEAAQGVYGQYMIGVFGAALKIGVFMMLIARMFRYAWQPFFLQHADDEDAKPLFSRVFTLYTAAGLIVLLMVSFFADELVRFPVPGVGNLIEQSYWIGLHVVPLVLLAYLFQGWYYIFSAGLYLTENTIYFVHCTIFGAVVTFGLNVWLVPYYGMAAAAWATVAAYAAMAGLLYIITQRVYPVNYAWDRIGAMGGLAAALLLLWYWTDALQKWWWELLFVAVFAASLVGLRIVSPQMIRSVLSRRASSE